MDKTSKFYDIVSIGGKSLTQVPLDFRSGETIIAPDWILSEFNETPFGSWFLSLLPDKDQSSTARRTKLLLWREVSAAASDPRKSRLLAEKEKIDELNKESDFVRIIAQDGNQKAPERYMATFTCRGIMGINANNEPIYGNRHEVEINCDYNFPSEPPKLRWITSIWHPNIHHRTKEVCINRKEWVAGMTIVDLCRQLFEMTQYKNYHAVHVEPHPLDGKVAKWVTEYGEPNNLMNKRKGIFVDNKPFTRPDSPFTSSLKSASTETKSRITILKPPPPRIKILGDAPPSTEHNTETKIVILR